MRRVAVAHAPRAVARPSATASPCTRPAASAVPRRSLTTRQPVASPKASINREKGLAPVLRGMTSPLLLHTTFVPGRNATSASAAPRPAEATSGDCAAALLGSVPLGVTDFSSIAPDADAYFDRSEYLVKLEKRGAFVRALRPKGFGKSLFLSSLALLHDCSTTESDFYAAFRGTSVARAVKNGDLQRGRYIVCRLDLSMVDWTGKPAEVRSSLQRHIHDRIGEVWYRYAARLGPRPLGENDPIKSFTHLLERVETTSPRSAPVGVYLLVDAYDAVSFDMMGRLHRDEHETGTTTLLHSLFAAFLEHRGPTGVGRIFIAGVTPLAIPLPQNSKLREALDDISLDESFDKIFGLTEEDIKRALRLVNPKESVVDMHINVVRQRLNRYRPTPTSTAVLYNTTAALDYLEKVKTGVVRSNNASTSAQIQSIDLAPGLLSQFASSRAGRRVLETVLAHGGIKFTKEELSQEYQLPQLSTKAEELRGDAAESLLKMLLLHLGGLTFEFHNPCTLLVAPSEAVANRMTTVILERYCLQKSQLFDAADSLAADDDPRLFLRHLEGAMAATVPIGDYHLATDMARQMRVLTRAAAHNAHPLEPGGKGAIVTMREARAGAKTFAFVLNALDDKDIVWEDLAKLPGLPKGPMTHPDILMRLQDEVVLTAKVKATGKSVAQHLAELAQKAPDMKEIAAEAKAKGSTLVSFMVVTVAARRCIYIRL